MRPSAIDQLMCCIAKLEPEIRGQGTYGLLILRVRANGLDSWWRWGGGGQVLQLSTRAQDARPESFTDPLQSLLLGSLALFALECRRREGGRGGGGERERERMRDTHTQRERERGRERERACKSRIARACPVDDHPMGPTITTVKNRLHTQTYVIVHM